MPDFTLTIRETTIYLSANTVGAQLWLMEHAQGARWSAGGSLVLDGNNLELLEAVELAGLKAA